MKIQPGVGYTFDSSSKGFTLDTSDPFPDAGPNQTYQQFECKVIAETTGGVTKFFLKTYKGVCNYTWSTFPFYPAPEAGGGEISFRSFEKQVRITDWAVYENGKRTAGSATDGPAFEWMAGDGKIELPAGESGKSVLVTISKIDWWDQQSWLSAYRTIDAERPFISVFDSADANIGGVLMQQGCSIIRGPVLFSGDSLTIDPPCPVLIGYTYKKIAQLDWNDTTESWDVTQYLVGPIDLPVQHGLSTTLLNSGTAPGTSSYDTSLASEFSDLLNYAWFESMWAYPGYTMNPSNWWFQLINE